MRSTVMLAAASALAASVACGAPEGAVSDRDLGLRKTDLRSDQVPPVAVVVGGTPGENTLLPRRYDGAPPLVPHAVEGLVPITRESNLCLMCHATGSQDPSGPTQLPKSHMTDLRNAPEVVRDTVAGARWNCTACHVPQTSAPPLVGNAFGTQGR